MDNLTHAALGLSVGILTVRKGASLPAAAVAALLAAEAPDLDIFIRNADDPLVSFRWHRHFTHSLIFAPVWMLLCSIFTAWFFRQINKPGVHWKDLLIPSFAGVMTHLLCDGCTSYGTMLLWPFNETRYAWDCLPIVDLFATLPLLACVIIALIKKSKPLASAGLLWFCAYAGLGMYQHHRAESSLQQWLAEQKITPEKIAVKPTITNLILWRGIWLNEGVWQVGAVRVAPFREAQIAPGDKCVAWTAQTEGNPPRGSFADDIIHDFSHFTQGWNAYERTPNGIVVGDIRFSMLPTSGRPLWAVHYGLDPQSLKEFQVEVVLDRDIHTGDWDYLKSLLLGTNSQFIPVSAQASFQPN